MEHWILLDKALPEGEKEVLFCNKDGQIFLGTLYKTKVKKAGTEYTARHQGEFMYKCIAWKPTPEPYKEEQDNCDYCQGDVALYYEDNENCAFVDNEGEMLVTAHDKTIRFKVEYCPKCGRKFIRKE